MRYATKPFLVKTITSRQFIIRAKNAAAAKAEVETDFVNTCPWGGADTAPVTKGERVISVKNFPYKFKK